MKLSEQELRWLNRWEKYERRWIPFTRWILVVNGIFSSVVGALLWHLVSKVVADGVPLKGLFISVPILCYGVAGVWFGLAVSKWRGDIKLRLLLRLIREHANEGS